MTERDHALLVEQMKGTAETIRAFAEQIESGEYESTWTVVEIMDDGDEREVSSAGDIRATSEDQAIERAIELYNLSDMGDERLDALSATIDDQAYEPTVSETSIDEYPLEIVDERGREFAVVICTGGPHIEVVADGGYNARLEGYWWGDRYTLHGDYLTTFLDYFIERD